MHTVEASKAKSVSIKTIFNSWLHQLSDNF